MIYTRNTIQSYCMHCKKSSYSASAIQPERVGVAAPSDPFPPAAEISGALGPPGV